MSIYSNSLTPRVKPWMIQSSLTFDSMDITLSVIIYWKAVEQYFTAVMFVFQFHSVYNYGKFLNFWHSALSGVKGLKQWIKL